MSTTAPCIVVGYDGSPASRAAVALAANRARAGGSVVVVHAFHVPPDWYGWPDYARLLAEPERHGQRLLAAVEEEVPALAGVPHELLHIARRPVTAVPVRGLRTNTEDDGGETRMETGAAERTFAS